ncbi:hypothetical protein VE03_10518, partial [Pseudogymnoascus sp. 23342-1-I1]
MDSASYEDSTRHTPTFSPVSSSKMSASVDFRAGSTASGGLVVVGVEVGVAWRPRATSSRAPRWRSRQRRLQHVMAEFPVRRQIVWRKNRETYLSKHGSYGIAVELQARGNDNATSCNSCTRGAGPFETGCVSFSSGYGPGNKVPFGGACANCFWGGQGGRCTLRVGG